MNKIDVLLLNLPTGSWFKKKFAQSISMPPLGLLSIATVLKEHGYRVSVIDFSIENFSQVRFIENLKALKPDLVGIATYNESWNAQKAVCSCIKEVLPSVTIVAGGAFATFRYEDILKESKTDFVIRGEGEYSMLELTEILIGDSDKAVSSISGIVYMQPSGELYVNPNLTRIKDLDKLPFPDRSFVDVTRYKIPFTISTARGCPGECIFCSSKAFWGRNVYMRSAENVFDEVMEIYRKYHNTVFSISDDTFTSSPKRIYQFCELLESTGIKFVWACESRADVITEELIRELTKAGCRKIQFGLESADNDVLRKLKKKVTIEQIERGIQIAHQYGLHVTASFIVGHVFDTPETVEKTLDFVQYIQQKYGTYVMGCVNTPFPGTEQYERAEELGLHIHTKDWSNYALWIPIISTQYISNEQLRAYYNRVVNIMNNNHLVLQDEVMGKREVL